MKLALAAVRGSRRGAESLERAAAILREAGADVTDVRLVAADGLREAFEGWVADGVERVAVGGGDGTLQAAVEAAAGLELELAFLPLGTANTTVRAAGLPANLEQACRIAATAPAAPIDLLDVGGRLGISVLSIGITASIARRMSGPAKRRFGMLAYVFQGGATVLRLRPFAATVRWSGGSRTFRSFQLIAANGAYYGPTRLSETTLGDGYIRLFLFEGMGRMQLAALWMRALLGGALPTEGVEPLVVEAFSIVTSRPKSIDVDGEPLARTPAEVRLRRGAVRVAGAGTALVRQG